jgi:hypothetical protein
MAPTKRKKKYRDPPAQPSANPERVLTASPEPFSVKFLCNVIESRYGDPRTFILNVRLWMRDYKITQRELSEEIGVDLTNLNRWLNQRLYPSLKNMLLIDEALERIIERRKA